MKPYELYMRVPESETKQITRLKGFHYDFVPEIENDNLYDVENERIAIKCYKYHCFDGRRIWDLSSVWFDNLPVMIIQNAGREGDDHAERFITNKNLYLSMIEYIRSLLPSPDVYDIVEETDEIPDLDRFYEHSLDGEFEHW